MKRRVVIEIKTESYMEEQFIHDRLPDAVWVGNSGGGMTVFYIDISEEERVLKALIEWKEIEEQGYKET